MVQPLLHCLQFRSNRYRIAIFLFLGKDRSSELEHGVRQSTTVIYAITIQQCNQEPPQDSATDSIDNNNDYYASIT